jgi:hypothetical protein
MASANSKIRKVIDCDLRWAQAHRDLDLKIIEEILSEKYQQIQADGSSISKEELLSSYRSGERLWEVSESSDHKVRISGDLAIMIGRWRGVGFNQGERFDNSARFLTIYELVDGIWKMLLGISVPIPE